MFQADNSLPPLQMEGSVQNKERITVMSAEAVIVPTKCNCGSLASTPLLAAFAMSISRNLVVSIAATGRPG